MNRRDFLKTLGVGVAAAAAPGAIGLVKTNTYKPDLWQVNAEWQLCDYGQTIGVAIKAVDVNGDTYRHGVMQFYDPDRKQDQINKMLDVCWDHLAENRLLLGNKPKIAIENTI